jgi:hypothetical protein
LKLTVNPSGEGVISGHVAGSVGDTALSFAPVTGSFSVAPDCTGTATITPKGESPLNFSFVVVECGKEMLAIETDANTVVSGTLQRIDLPSCDDEQLSEGAKQAVEARDAYRKSLLRTALELGDEPAIDRIEAVVVYGSTEQTGFPGNVPVPLGSARDFKDLRDQVARR